MSPPPAPALSATLEDSAASAAAAPQIEAQLKALKSQSAEALVEIGFFADALDNTEMRLGNEDLAIMKEVGLVSERAANCLAQILSMHSS